MPIPARALLSLLSLLLAPGLCWAAAPPSSERASLPEAALFRLGSTQYRGDGVAGDAALSPDGKLLAVTERSGVRLWDLASGRLVRSLEFAKPDVVDRVYFSPDGKVIAAVTPRAVHV